MSDFSEVNWGFSASQRAGELEDRVKTLEHQLKVLTLAIFYMNQMIDGRWDLTELRKIVES